MPVSWPGAAMSETAGRGGRLRRGLIGGVTIVSGLAVGLIVAEVVLRLTWTPPVLRSTPVEEAHAIYRSVPRPAITGKRMSSEFEYAFTHSAQGMRGSQEFAMERPPGTTMRVLVLGDSFTYGVGVADDEVFVDRLRRALPGVEFINAGCSGYGQREQLAILDQLGAALRPDLVIATFFWNDLGDNFNKDWPAFAFDATGRVVRTDLAVPDDFDPLARRTARPIDEQQRARNTVYLKRLYRGALRGLRYRMFGVRTRFPATPAERAAAWEVTRPYLAMMKARAAEIGAGFLLVSIPGQDRVDPDAHIDGIEPLAVDIEEMLTEVTAALDIEYWNLLEPLRAAHRSADERLYYFADRHLTVLGNRVVADLLAQRFGDRFGRTDDAAPASSGEVSEN